MHFDFCLWTMLTPDRLEDGGTFRSHVGHFALWFGRGHTPQSPYLKSERLLMFHVLSILQNTPLSSLRLSCLFCCPSNEPPPIKLWPWLVLRPLLDQPVTWSPQGGPELLQQTTSSLKTAYHLQNLHAKFGFRLCWSCKSKDASL